MSDDSVTQKRRNQERQAALWVNRIDDHKLDPMEQKAFNAWLVMPCPAGTPSNKVVFARLAKQQMQLNRLTQIQPAAPRPSIDSAPLKTKLGFSVSHWAAASIACFAIILSGVSISGGQLPFGLANPFASQDTIAIYTTHVGEQKTINLDDGSVITLNTNSHVRVNLTPKYRSIHLIKGEAFFDVAKDKNRPFEVNANNKVVRAVGTAFAVRNYQQGRDKITAVEVTVTEGRVELAKKLSNEDNKNINPSQTQSIAFLDQGQGATIGHAEQLSIHNVSAELIAQKLAWRQDMLLFKGNNLDYVLLEFSRYSPQRVEIASPQLKELSIGGYFKADDISTFLQTLTTQFAVDIQHQDDGSITLYAL